jgi:hypothetical protein
MQQLLRPERRANLATIRHCSMKSDGQADDEPCYLLACILEAKLRVRRNTDGVSRLQFYLFTSGHPDVDATVQHNKNFLVIDMMGLALRSCRDFQPPGA